MDASFIALDWLDIALALGLMGLVVVLSLWQGLTLAGQWVMATGRTILQLLVAGYWLTLIFAINQPWAVLLAIGVMVTIAAIVARNRISKKIKNLLPLLWVSLGASNAITLAYVIVVIIQPPTWYSPQYLIPLTGMVLGNGMNAATLAGERLVSRLKESPGEIETYLSLGATPQQAIASYRKAAMQAGLIPIINQMMVVGLVSLPGMLTGQVLSGIDPLTAALYQILIMIMIAFGNLVAVILVTQGIARSFFNSAAQFVNH
ncbi:ABC transporter permease [Spirulina subsalsa]|uniref:ABC transporter permease n=1 Tax=Spirulina subsalsa TaxID=54311 RepID=UPI00030D2B95|nr:iron export ABC transporter permease subunit FetB [Spirulina subsalsa]